MLQRLIQAHPSNCSRLAQLEAHVFIQFPAAVVAEGIHSAVPFVMANPEEPPQSVEFRCSGQQHIVCIKLDRGSQEGR